MSHPTPSYPSNQHQQQQQQHDHYQQQQLSPSPSPTPTPSTTVTITSTSIDTQRFYCPFLQRGLCREAPKCESRSGEREMESSFAVQCSKDKVCGICMDTVVEKKSVASRMFGLLENCNHIFCYDCITRWRGIMQLNTRMTRACPECRVSSDFVVPSRYWIEDQDDKDKLINDYKMTLRSMPCKYFNEGNGDCPFAGSCFYKHAYPDGRIATWDNQNPFLRPSPSTSFNSSEPSANQSSIDYLPPYQPLPELDEVVLGMKKFPLLQFVLLGFFLALILYSIFIYRARHP